jgi:hypothetical protein
VVDSGGTADPARIAAEIAPQLDRARLAVVDVIRTHADEVSQRYTLSPPALQTLGMLRHTLPDRAVAISDVLELFLYSAPDLIRSSLDQLVAAGALKSAGAGHVVVTHKGRDAVHTMLELTQQFVDELWAGHTDLVARLLPLTDRACEAVMTTGGAAVRIVAPTYDPPSASPALKLAERLTPLRFHRFDAHAEAWRNEGLTIEEIQALEPGPLLDRIEVETNRWAAAPYCALEPDQRLELLHGLEALPSKP